MVFLRKSNEAHRLVGPPVSLKCFRARQSRAELIQRLGAKCVQCGATHQLELDCWPLPETSHHFMPMPERVRFYWRMHQVGNIRLLCKSCHVRLTGLDQRARFLRRLAATRTDGAYHAYLDSASLTLRSRSFAVVAALSAVPFYDGDGI